VGETPSEAESFARTLEKARGGKIVAWLSNEEGTSAPRSGSRWEAISKAALLWEEGKSSEGVEVLRRYLKTNEEDRLLRFQKWSVEFPDRIHEKSIDPAWLLDQEKKERAGG
jgi:hypothetical protein